jgi:hypothetical protein
VHCTKANRHHLLALHEQPRYAGAGHPATVLDLNQTNRNTTESTQPIYHRGSCVLPALNQMNHPQKIWHKRCKH